MSKNENKDTHDMNFYAQLESALLRTSEGGALARAMENEQEIIRERRFLSLLSASNESGSLICKLEKDYPLVYIGSNLPEFLGYDSKSELSEACGGLSLRLLHRDDRGVTERSYGDQLADGDFAEAEFRVHNKDGSYKWVLSKTSRVEDEFGHPLLTCFWIDITRRKLKEESLRERIKLDPLTQLYNKVATEETIRDYIKSTHNPGAFMMLDIDNFKGINDTLGHLYGDAVLSELAHTLKSIFRASDITGRFGGDEFCIFMTNIGSEDTVRDKANEVLRAFERSFDENEIHYEISCSIGIALYPEQGRSFTDLMTMADQALYHAKKHGKNKFCFYDKNDVVPETRILGRPDDDTLKSQKNFREHVAEYILNIFYEYDDVNKAVPVLFDLVGKAYNVDRIYINEFDDEEESFNYSYEWCNSGVSSLKSSGAEKHERDWKGIRAVLDDDNIICVADIDEVYPDLFRTDELRKAGVKSMTLCYVVESGKRKAVVGFDYNERHYASDEERNTVSAMSKIVTMFILRARERQAARDILMRQSNKEAMLDDMDELVYVSDRDTYEMYYLNRTGRNAICCGDTDAYLGQKCYELLQRRREPCPFCTNHLLTRDKFYVWEHTNPNTSLHYILKDKLIEWNGKLARIEWAIDVTEKESTNKALVSRLSVEKMLLSGVEEMASANDADDAVMLALKRVGEFYKADRGYTMSIDPSGASVSITNEWNADGVEPQKDNLQDVDLLTEAPFWGAAIRSRKTILMESLDELKRDYPDDYLLLAAQGISSLYAVPIIINGEVGGYIGVDNPREHEGDIYILASLSFFIANEITKRGK